MYIESGLSAPITLPTPSARALRASPPTAILTPQSTWIYLDLPGFPIMAVRKYFTERGSMSRSNINQPTVQDQPEGPHSALRIPHSDSLD